MSLLDSDLMEKIDVPMIFEAINKLKKVMDDNLEEIYVRKKEISDLYKNVTDAKSELTKISTLLEQIVNPQKQPIYLVDLMDGKWTLSSNPNYTYTIPKEYYETFNTQTTNQITGYAADSNQPNYYTVGTVGNYMVK